MVMHQMVDQENGNKYGETKVRFRGKYYTMDEIRRKVGGKPRILKPLLINFSIIISIIIAIIIIME